MKNMFIPPSHEERVKAIGRLNDLPMLIKKAFEPSEHFSPIPMPGPGDWLSVHREPGQSFEEYVKLNPLKPDKVRKFIYIQPIGTFIRGVNPPISLLVRFTEAFFCMKVKLLRPVMLSDISVKTRINPYTAKRQILTSDILNFLKDEKPADSFCLLAITMEDLYPEPSWNFVFGQASLTDRVGVFSFARYDPAFYGEVRGSDYQKLLLKRSCKVLAHETCHMLLLYHCIYFHCLMNGSNHLQESDARPLHLCPVCLRKVHYCIQFDIIERYKNLLKFYEENDFREEAEWILGRLRNLEK